MLLCGGTVALLCFAASLLHECGHLLFLSLYDADFSMISFGAGGVVIERRDDCFCGFLPECMIALGGIFMNLLLCAVCGGVYCVNRSQVCGVLCVVNGVIAAVNLLPVRSLDCSRFFELLLFRFGCERTEPILKRVSLCTVCLFTLGCVCLFCCGFGNPSLAAVCVYMILLHWKTE